MKFGRILRSSLEGPQARLVVAQPEEGRVIDLTTAEVFRLRRRGATPGAARRLASALYPGSMSEALAAGPAFVEAVACTIASSLEEQAILPIDGVRWLAPVDPPVMRDCMAFEQHLRASFAILATEVPIQYYEQPLYYKGNPLTLIGHEETVPWPVYGQLLDYELELGFVIGRAGKDLTADEAVSHLFGVTILNDFSARDTQAGEMNGRLGPAKSKDFGSALGPWITTSDELDVHNLTMVARVNGEEWSRGSSASMMWRVEEIIAYISQCEGVQPGELIGSGTMGGGCGLELGRFLTPGSIVELEIDGIGTLRNALGTPGEMRWSPIARTPEEQV